MSLKWRFMIAPLISVAILIVLIIQYSLVTQKQNDLLNLLLSNEVKVTTHLVSTANVLAINHAELYALLKESNTLNEGEFYDQGKALLLKLHDIEDNITAFEDNQIRDESTRQLVELLAQYRQKATNSVLTASVDLSLANSVLNESTLQFNALNSGILSLSEKHQKAFRSKVKTQRLQLQSEADRLIYMAVGLLVLNLMASFLLSNILSRRLHSLVDFLNKLLQKQGANTTFNAVEKNEVSILGEVSLEIQRTIDTLAKEVENRLIAEENVSVLNRELEQRVEERTKQLTDSNKDLTEAMSKLQDTQTKLLETDKMAALGGLVAGVAHELNTPVGTALTALSHMGDSCSKINQALNSGTLSEQSLRSALNTIEQACDLSLSNISRAIEQIKSFKLVAVDSNIDEARDIELGSYIQDVLNTLAPQMKGTPHKIVFNCKPNIHIQSYPSAIFQIISNFVMNSLIHGFGNDIEGIIDINVILVGDNVEIYYSDNGIGLSPQVKKHIFEPFYTTKRGQGGSGLGAHIIYNLVTQKLDGSIEIIQREESGACFKIVVPTNYDNEAAEGSTH